MRVSHSLRSFLVQARWSFGATCATFWLQAKVWKWRLRHDRSWKHENKQAYWQWHHLDDLARHHGPWSSKTMARSLELNFADEAVSDRTVRRILHRKLHFKFGKLWRKFKLTELHKQNRVVWSLLHAEDGWERTLFLDEYWSCFALIPNGARSWYPDGNGSPIFKAEQFPKKLHVLGAISS